MISIIRNKELERFKKAGNYILVYGRRKTGKSFLIKNYINWDKFYFVGRNNVIYDEDTKIFYESFEREVMHFLKEGKTVVIDEFQRLPVQFLDRLHSFGKKGKLILISSTLLLTKKILNKNSPILGMFSEIKIPLIDEIDILLGLQKYLKGKKLIEYSLYLREPWLIPLFEKNKKDFILEVFLQSKLSIPALIGEIFFEEERHLSKVYEAILKAVSDGKRITTEIANLLYSEKLIPKNDPSVVHPYLDILCKVGILEKIKEIRKRKFFYYHTSCAIDTYYYLDTKYGFSEREIAVGEIKKVINTLLPRHIENFFGNILSKIFNLKREVFKEKDYDIDIVLSDLKKPKIVAEVKWKKITKKDLEKIYQNLNRINAEKKILIIPQKEQSGYKNIQIWDIQDISKMIKVLY
jgi:hypothetical protein